MISNADDTTASFKVKRQVHIWDMEGKKISRLFPK
jgi:hypothetical protein